MEFISLSTTNNQRKQHYYAFCEDKWFSWVKKIFEHNRIIEIWIVFLISFLDVFMWLFSD